MQILGKIKIQGKEKEILLKEENEFFKYYSLELIGAYAPQISEEEIIFKKESKITKEVKIEVISLLRKIQILQIIKIIKEQNNIQILGKIHIENKPKELILKKEGENFKYYYLELIGVYTPKYPGETIIFKQDTLENSLSAEIKDKEPINKKFSLEKEQIEQFLERIKIWDIMERIQTQEKGTKQRTQYNKEIKENEIKKQQVSQKREQKDAWKQPKQQQKESNKQKQINIKQEVDLDTKVTDMSDLGKVLTKNKKMPKLEHGDEALKMGIVESDDMKNLKNEKGQKEQGHTSRYEAVIITKKGKVQKLDLENDTQEGTNPLEKNYQVKQNNTVQKGDVLTRLKVGKGTIGIEKGQYGEVEVYHSANKTIGGKGVQGNQSLDRQLETPNAKNVAKGTNPETQKLAQEYQDGYRSVEEGYQEIKRHEQKYPACETKSVKDLDGKSNTQSHTHETEEFVELSTGEKVTYRELASRWGFYKDGKPDATFVKEKFAKKEKENQKAEDVIEELDEEFEDPRANDRRR